MNDIALKLTLTNFREADLSAESTSPFAKLGFKADRWKAYVECEVCHSLPDGRLVGAGHGANGNIIAFWPDVIANSHGGLVHQQFNIGHKIAAYAADDKKANAEDRIVGCVIATHVEQKPMEGWYSPTNLQGKGNHIRALVVVWKLAKGVNKIIGDHLASRVEQSVSIETIVSKERLGIMRPSTGEGFAFLDMPEDWALTVKAAKPGFLPKVGMIDGEQLVLTYGIPGGTVEFRGLAMTPNPAEATAKVVSIAASKVDDETFAIAAESVNDQLVGKKVKFHTGRIGEVVKVSTSGAGLMGVNASQDDPLLTVKITRFPFVPQMVERPLSKLAENFC